MAKDKPDVDANVAALATAVAALFSRVSDLTVRAETLRLLLEKYGVCTHAEFEQAHAQAQAAFDRELAVAGQDVSDAILRQLLESHEGTKQ